MESLSKLVKVTLPAYLSDLPIPDSFGGLFRLGVSDWFRLTPIITLLSTSTYMTYRYIIKNTEDSSEDKRKSKVNLNIKKDCSKCVDQVDIEEIGDKKVYCRCWRSKSFPLCDGSHNTHNEITGDNVGPLIVKK